MVDKNKGQITAGDYDLEVGGSKKENITGNYNLDVKKKADWHFDELEIHVKGQRKEFHEEKFFRWVNGTGYEIFATTNEMVLAEESKVTLGPVIFDVKVLLSVEIAVGLLFEYASIAVDLHGAKADLGILLIEAHAVHAKTLGIAIKKAIAKITKTDINIDGDEVQIE